MAKKIVSLDEATLERLQKASAETGIAESEIVRRALAFFLGSGKQGATRAERSEENRCISREREKMQAMLWRGRDA